jgi:hypothetical protein
VTQPAQLPWGSCLATLPNAQGVLDLTPDMQMATGRDVLAQSIIRRQTTPRGSVLVSPNDCIDIRSMLSQGMTLAQLQSLSDTIRVELLKDQRVNAAQVQINFNPLTNVTTITESIFSSTGPFTLTLTLSANTIAVVIKGQ